jgi:hypothetical protein
VNYEIDFFNLSILVWKSYVYLSETFSVQESYLLVVASSFMQHPISGNRERERENEINSEENNFYLEKWKNTRKMVQDLESLTINL